MQNHGVKERQNPLISEYRQHPNRALIVDRAKSFGGPGFGPFHGQLQLGSENLKAVLHFGIHHAVGGYHDLPNPGDLLCGALAACLDSTIRIIAERLQIPLAHLEVEVTANLDVRGTLQVDRNVDVGFQTINYHLLIKPQGEQRSSDIQRLIAAAEKSCVNLHTLKTATTCTTTLVLA